MSKAENQAQWKSLCDFIKVDILKYGEDKIFPKTLVFRLKGLARGQEYAKGEGKQIYSYEFIEKVFKVFQFKILEIINKTNIKDEKHLCNLIMKIIQDNFNDIIELEKKRIQNKEKLETVKQDMIIDDLTYIPKNKKVGGLW